VQYEANKEDGPQESVSRSNVPFIVIGTFLVFIAMMFLNTASLEGFTEESKDGEIVFVPPEKVIMNTILSGSTGALATMLLKNKILPNNGNFSQHKTLNTSATCNGLIAGLVSVSAASQHMEQWAAAFVGTLGGLSYLVGCRIFTKLRIDDPLESSQVFGFGGFAGVLLAGLFDNTKGLFYVGNGGFRQIGIQVVGALTIVGYSIIVSSLAFFMIKKTGQLRVHKFYEIVGLDSLVHGQILNQSIGKYSEVT